MNEEMGGLLLGVHRELAEGEVTDSIALTGSDTTEVTFTIPEDAQPGDTIHIVVEGEDSGAME